MRLIDADALIKEVDRIHKDHYANSSYQFIHDFFLAMFRRIRKQPTIDAVPVVRCEDCKHFHKSIAFSRGGVWCEHHGIDIDADDFCSYGERRSDDRQYL